MEGKGHLRRQSADGTRDEAAGCGPGHEAMPTRHISQERGLSVITVLGGVCTLLATPQEGGTIRVGDSDANELGSWGCIASVIDWANEYRHWPLKAAKPEACKVWQGVPSSGLLSSGTDAVAKGTCWASLRNPV